MDGRTEPRSIGEFDACYLSDEAAVDPAVVSNMRVSARKNILHVDPATGVVTQRSLAMSRAAFISIYDEIVVRHHPPDHGVAGPRPLSQIDEPIGRLFGNGAPNRVVLLPNRITSICRTGILGHGRDLSGLRRSARDRRQACCRESAEMLEY